MFLVEQRRVELLASALRKPPSRVYTFGCVCMDLHIFNAGANVAANTLEGVPF
jgi:hypothetical protein